MEEWRDIPGYEGEYQVSDFGRVRSLGRFVRCGLPNLDARWVRERFLSLFPDKDGYLFASLRAKGCRVHTLVLAAFVGPRQVGFEVAHRDGVKSNNALSNLRYATSRENADDRVRHGTNVRGERQHKSRLTVEDVRTLRRTRGLVRQVDLAAQFGVSQSTVSAVQLGKSWSWI